MINTTTINMTEYGCYVVADNLFSYTHKFIYIYTFVSFVSFTLSFGSPFSLCVCTNFIYSAFTLYGNITVNP